MDPTELEQIVDRALARLPAPRAPRTLAPRVMHAVRLAESHAAMPARGWFAWSREWQAVSVTAMLALVVGLWFMGPVILEGLGSFKTPVVSDTAGALDGARVIWRVLRPVLLAGVAFVGVMSALCAAGAAALRRVTA